MNSRPVILLMLDGLGLSSSWKGNAFATANLSNFNHLWRKYEHYTLGTRISENYSSAIDANFAYSAIATGQMPESNKMLIDKKIAKESFSANQSYISILKRVSSHNSVLHLVGNISKDDQSSSLDHVIELIRVAKENSIFRVCIHLIVDDSFENVDQLKTKISFLEQNSLGVGEIMTIVGQSVLNSQGGLASTLLAINQGRGKRYLSSIQAISNQVDALPHLFDPLIATKNVAKVSDFDAIVFFNHDPKKILPLIEAYSSDLHPGKCPKYSFLVSLGDYLFSRPEKITVLFSNFSKETLIEIIHKSGLRSLVVSEECKARILKHSFALNKKVADEAYVACVSSRQYYRDYAGIIGRMVKLLAEKLKDKKYDFILADVPALEKVCQFCTFSETVMALNYIDKLLLMLEEVVIESDGVLVITSPYGMAESMVAATSVRGEDYKCVPSSNPVPMLVISKETMANEAKSSILLHDIAFSNKSLSFIFTKILNCLNIGQSN